jgi:5-methylcytosine-specific restriction endonuclease McrA
VPFRDGWGVFRRVNCERAAVATRRKDGFSLFVGNDPKTRPLLLEPDRSQSGVAFRARRRRSAGYISGTLRYEVLKAAKFRCELCGISAEERAVEVDHIRPRNKGGCDEISNLQAICHTCNAMKRDRDDTDFRAVKTAYCRRSPKVHHGRSK